MMDMAYDKSKGWYEGTLGKKRFMTAPYSKLAACHLKEPAMTPSGSIGRWQTTRFRSTESRVNHPPPHDRLSLLTGEYR